MGCGDRGYREPGEVVEVVEVVLVVRPVDTAADTMERDVVLESWPVYLVNGGALDAFDAPAAAWTFEQGVQARRERRQEKRGSYTENVLVEFGDGGRSLLRHERFDRAAVMWRWKPEHRVLELLYDAAVIAPGNFGRVRDSESGATDSGAEGDGGAMARRDDRVEEAPRRRPHAQLHRFRSTLEPERYHTLLLRRVALPDGTAAFVAVPMHTVLHMAPTYRRRDADGDISDDDDDDDDGDDDDASLTDGDDRADAESEAPAIRPVEVRFQRRHAHAQPQRQRRGRHDAWHQYWAVRRERWYRLGYRAASHARRSAESREQEEEELKADTLRQLSRAPAAPAVSATEHAQRWTPHRHASPSTGVWFGGGADADGAGATATVPLAEPSSAACVSVEDTRAWLLRLFGRAPVIPHSRLLPRCPWLRGGAGRVDHRLRMWKQMALWVRGAWVLDSATAVSHRLQPWMRTLRESELARVMALRDLVLTMFADAGADGTVSVGTVLRAAPTADEAHVRCLLADFGTPCAPGIYAFVIGGGADADGIDPTLRESAAQRLRQCAAHARTQWSSDDARPATGSAPVGTRGRHRARNPRVRP